MIKFRNWVLLNILLPTVPLIFQLIIYFRDVIKNYEPSLFLYGIYQRISITDILWYSFFISIIGLNVKFNKKSKERYRSIVATIFYCIMVFDLLLAALNYINNDNRKFDLIIGFLLAAVAVILTYFFKKRELTKSKPLRDDK